MLIMTRELHHSFIAEFVLTINPTANSEGTFWTIEGDGHEIYNYGFQLE